MADQNKKEEISTPEKKISEVERQPRPADIEKKFERESFAPESEDKIVSEELRREIELMEADDKAKAEAEKAKEKIEFLGEKDKIEHLLDLARKKGVVFAVQVARKMNEPYLLDVLHDTLAREGYYKDFTK